MTTTVFAAVAAGAALLAGPHAGPGGEAGTDDCAVDAGDTVASCE